MPANCHCSAGGGVCGGWSGRFSSARMSSPCRNVCGFTSRRVYREPRRILRPQVVPESTGTLGMEERSEPQEHKHAHRTALSIRAEFVRGMESHAWHACWQYRRITVALLMVSMPTMEDVSATVAGFFKNSGEDFH